MHGNDVHGILYQLCNSCPRLRGSDPMMEPKRPNYRNILNLRKIVYSTPIYFLEKVNAWSLFQACRSKNATVMFYFSTCTQLYLNSYVSI